jgi:curved DNA-binding protein
MLLSGRMSVSGIHRTVSRKSCNGQVFRLRGLGMPKRKHPDQRGDFYITLDAVLPQNLFV